MIIFDCPVCSRSYRVPESKAGLRTRCAECTEPLVVPLATASANRPRPSPAHSASESERRNEPESLTTGSPAAVRHLWWVAGAVLLVILSAVMGLVVLTDKTAHNPGGADKKDTNQGQTEARAQREQVTEQTEKLRAEQASLRTEVERNRAELARLKDEQARKDANRATEEALVKVRLTIAEMGKLDTEARVALVKFDQEGMFRFAQDGIDPQDTNQMKVKDFYNQRRELTDKTKGRLTKMLDEARQVASSVQEAPADIKGNFDNAVGRELRRGEAILKSPLPDPLAFYGDAVVAVKTINDIVRQQKVEKSKTALAVLVDYEKSLPVGYKVTVSLPDLHRVLLLMVELNSLHAKKKLTKETALKALKECPHIIGREGQFAMCLKELLMLGGDVRHQHDPDRPSYRETFELFRELVDYDSIEKDLLKGSRQRGP
jgi:hypothetical protein